MKKLVPSFFVIHTSGKFSDRWPFFGLNLLALNSLARLFSDNHLLIFDAVFFSKLRPTVFYSIKNCKNAPILN
jgi:hypothetical protein